MIVIGIDPGNTQTAYAEYAVKAGTLISCDIVKNEQFFDRIITLIKDGLENPVFVIEKVACYGMAVGETVFETVFWSGKFAQFIESTECPVDRITRHTIKMHLCHSARAKDGNIRQALIDRFGGVGTKKNPGPLFGMAADKWAALAVAVTWSDQNGAKHVK